MKIQIFHPKNKIIRQNCLADCQKRPQSATFFGITDGGDDNADKGNGAASSNRTVVYRYADSSMDFS